MGSGNFIKIYSAILVIAYPQFYVFYINFTGADTPCVCQYYVRGNEVHTTQKMAVKRAMSDWLMEC